MCILLRTRCLFCLCRIYTYQTIFYADDRVFFESFVCYIIDQPKFVLFDTGMVQMVMTVKNKDFSFIVLR